MAVRLHLSPVLDLVRGYIDENGLQPGDRFPVDLVLAKELGWDLGAAPCDENSSAVGSCATSSQNLHISHTA